MILGFPKTFPPDAIEAHVPDAGRARALVRERTPALLDLLERRRRQLAPQLASASEDLKTRVEDAILIAFCRLAFRHGSWGSDFHAYHNENHILEILDTRIDRLIETIGIAALPLCDWLLLELFAACHDLRQREMPEFAAGVGSNERASIEEAFRILKVCGFEPTHQANIFQALELMIAGSTFDARPAASVLEYNSAELVHSGGALALKLDQKLDKHSPDWRSHAHLPHALELALIAADLDTANVAEPFALFAASAENLCREREMRSHRQFNEAASAQPVLQFLTEGQESFFFELHRFNSDVGRAAFEHNKLANAPKLQTLCRKLRERVAESGPPRSGNQVLECYRAALSDTESNAD